MNFDESVAVVLRLEGGSKITDDPHDGGGLTRYGISLRAHPELGAEGIRQLTEEKARAIYRQEYWDRLGIDQLPPYARLPIFDGAVNHGREGAVKLIQKSLVAMGSEILQDGVLGVKTLMALQKANAVEFVVEYLYQRFDAYIRMKKFKIFGKGWVKRIIRLALAMR